MSGMTVVDTHLHLWDPIRLRYRWLDNLPSLNRPFRLAEFDQARGSIDVRKMVFLQCDVDPAQSRQEADWITSLAARDLRLAGMVPWAPLERGEAARETVAGLAQNSLVKGIRRLLQSEPDPGFCLRPDFVRGVQLLADSGLHFEICLKGDRQFANAVELARQCPEVKFVLDHLGKPFIKERILEPWRTNLKQLAGLPNTWCKISGLVTEADHQRWTSEDLKPYIEWVIECFGWDRVMFGGDWPVCTLAASYRRWVETLDALVGKAAEADKRKLFHENAVEFYRVG